MIIPGSNSFQDSSSRLWFESLSSAQEPSLRLFCFPYAGGNIQVFRSWYRHFPSEIDICLVHLPGRGERFSEPPYTHIERLVEILADLIVREPPTPYALFGHSMGAIISFELARELQRKGFCAPRELFLSGRAAPTVPERQPPIFNLPDDAFIAEVKRLNGTPAELLDDQETREFFLPALRADFEIVGTYEYQLGERVSSPITVYGGLQDREVLVKDLWNWQEQTSARCKVTTFAGDHFFIHKPGGDFIRVFRSDVLSILRHAMQ